MLPLVRQRALGLVLLVGLWVFAGCGQADVPPTASASPVEPGHLQSGPLALVLGGNGDQALTAGVLQITDTCVFLSNRNEKTLLIWPSSQTAWEPATRTILFVDRDGQLHRLVAGQRVSFGGGGGGAGEGDPLAQLDLPWVVPPMPECAAPRYWFVGDLAN